MVLENIKLSQREKEHLVQLKRRTKIPNWNVLCRWALVTSLAEPSVPPEAKLASDSSIEMSWRTFGGEYAELYAALIRQRCQHDGLGNTADVLAKYFRLHLHRGIGYLFADRSMQTIRHLVERAVGTSSAKKRGASKDEDPAGQDGAATS
jgi:DNA sulfur modification protein DndE